MVLECREENMRFDLDYEQVIIVSTERAKETTERILKENAIPAMASKDLAECIKDQENVKE